MTLPRGLPYCFAGLGAILLVLASAAAHAQTTTDDSESAKTGQPGATVSEATAPAVEASSLWVVVQKTDGTVLTGTILSMTSTLITLQSGVNIVTIPTSEVARIASVSLDSADEATPAPPALTPERAAPVPSSPPAFQLQLMDHKGNPVDREDLVDFNKPLLVAEVGRVNTPLAIPRFVESMDRPWLTRRWLDNVRRESVRKRIGLAILGSGAGVLIGGLTSLLAHGIFGSDDPGLILASAAVSWSSLPAFILGGVVHLEGQIRFRQMQQSEINLLVTPVEAGALVETHNASQ